MPFVTAARRRSTSEAGRKAASAAMKQPNADHSRISGELHGVSARARIPRAPCRARRAGSASLRRRARRRCGPSIQQAGDRVEANFREGEAHAALVQRRARLPRVASHVRQARAPPPQAARAPSPARAIARARACCRPARAPRRARSAARKIARQARDVRRSSVATPMPTRPPRPRRSRRPRPFAARATKRAATRGSAGAQHQGSSVPLRATMRMRVPAAVVRRERREPRADELAIERTSVRRIELAEIERPSACRVRRALEGARRQLPERRCGAGEQRQRVGGRGESRAMAGVVEALGAARRGGFGVGSLARAGTARGRDDRALRSATIRSAATPTARPWRATCSASATPRASATAKRKRRAALARRARGSRAESRLQQVGAPRPVRRRPGPNATRRRARRSRCLAATIARRCASVHRESHFDRAASRRARSGIASSASASSGRQGAALRRAAPRTRCRRRRRTKPPAAPTRTSATRPRRGTGRDRGFGDDAREALAQRRRTSCARRLRRPPHRRAAAADATRCCACAGPASWSSSANAAAAATRSAGIGGNTIRASRTADAASTASLRVAAGHSGAAPAPSARDAAARRTTPTGLPAWVRARQRRVREGWTWCAGADAQFPCGPAQPDAASRKAFALPTRGILVYSAQCPTRASARRPSGRPRPSRLSSARAWAMASPWRERTLTRK